MKETSAFSSPLKGGQSRRSWITNTMKMNSIVALLVICIFFQVFNSVQVLRNLEVDEAIRTVLLPTKKSFSEKKDAPAPVQYDDVVQTMEITEQANRAVLQSVPEKKDAPAPVSVLHDDVVLQPIEITEHANRAVLQSVHEKRDAPAPELHDNVVLNTFESTEANRAVLQSIHEKKNTPAPLLHDDVVLQTMDSTEANMALERRESIPSRVTHLMNRTEFQNQDPYSGMWWQNVEGFMKFPPGVGTLESASFAAFRGKTIRMTSDWLDFAVEHLSIYHRHFEVHRDSNKPAYIIMKKQMKGFMERAQQIVIEDDMAPRWTVAILPYTDNFSGKRLAHGPGGNKREIRIDALAATLASLWQFGIGRVVLVGKTQADEESVSTAFDRLRAYQPTVPRSMELAFTVGPPNQKGMVPYQAIHGLQMALQGHPSMTAADIEKWLGAKHMLNATRWKYVYYSEPDLVLNSRASAIPTLTAELADGRLIAAHRLQPIPHALDFPGFDDQFQKTVPAMGNLSHVYDMHSDKSACCDAGNGRPGREIKQKCSTFWWQCGLNHRNKKRPNIDEVMELHVKKLPYSFIRLKTGTGITMMAATQHARMCSVVQYGTCNADKTVSVMS